MKKTIFLFFAIVYHFAANSQVDSSFMDVTLKAKHHAFLTAFMPDKGGEEQIFYMNQVAELVIFDSTGQPKDTAQLITVKVSKNLVAYLYLSIGMQQERLTASYNKEIQKALSFQIDRHPEVKAAIGVIAMQSAKDLAEKVQSGFWFLWRIRPR